MFANTTNLAVLTLTTFALFLAGCSEVGTIGAKAELTFDGTGSGSHDDPADCGDDAQLTGSGNVQTGEVRITVRDGGGDGVFTETYSGDFDFDSRSINGASGTWEISAQRGGEGLVGDDFEGNYSFRLDC